MPFTPFIICGACMFAFARGSFQQQLYRKTTRINKLSKRPTRAMRYNAFMSKAKELGPRGQWREVLRLLDQLSEDGIPLNSYTYNSAMSSIAKSGR